MVGHPPRHHARNPCSSAPWAPWERGRGADARLYACVGGRACEAASRRADRAGAHATIDPPPLPTQQNPDPQVPEARPRVRELANAQPQCELIARATAAIPRRTTEV